MTELSALEDVVRVIKTGAGHGIEGTGSLT